MICEPFYTRHFAIRYVERFDKDLKKLSILKRVFKEMYCQHVFDCMVYGNKRRVLIEDVYITYVFDYERRRLICTTCY